jgi:uncharacterized oxidoreductase
MNQQDDERQMPLDEFLDEAVALLKDQPDAKEITVNRVRLLRDAVAKGTYADVLKLLSSHAVS